MVEDDTLGPIGGKADDPAKVAGDVEVEGKIKRRRERNRESERKRDDDDDNEGGALELYVRREQLITQRQPPNNDRRKLSTREE